jgi:Carboxypeptidase regulatory-like domain
MTLGNNLALMTVVCLSLIPVSVYAQGSTASLTGTVRDEQGLVAPGAAVTLAATENTFSRTVTTDASGAFEFAGLLPGGYKMPIELAGFAPKAVNVSIAVNQRVRLDVVLQAGVVAQQVEVTTTVPLLHVSDASLGEVIDQQQVSELPLNGRQVLELALLVTGAHTSHGAQMAT